ncbi:MAG: hypothetical protein Q7S98_03470, partial [Deltaproteobacteria bacterium]|nr:hypothetical protein [Deltaproteobacteria bacterium]
MGKVNVIIEANGVGAQLMEAIDVDADPRINDFEAFEIDQLISRFLQENGIDSMSGADISVSVGGTNRDAMAIHNAAQKFNATPLRQRQALAAKTLGVSLPSPPAARRSGASPAAPRSSGRSQIFNAETGAPITVAGLDSLKFDTDAALSDV